MKTLDFQDEGLEFTAADFIETEKKPDYTIDYKNLQMWNINEQNTVQCEFCVYNICKSADYDLKNYGFEIDEYEELDKNLNEIINYNFKFNVEKFINKVKENNWELKNILKIFELDTEIPSAIFLYLMDECDESTRDQYRDFINEFVWVSNEAKEMEKNFDTWISILKRNVISNFITDSKLNFEPEELEWILFSHPDLKAEDLVLCQKQFGKEFTIEFIKILLNQNSKFDFKALWLCKKERKKKIDLDRVSQYPNINYTYLYILKEETRVDDPNIAIASIKKISEHLPTRNYSMTFSIMGQKIELEQYQKIVLWELSIEEIISFFDTALGQKIKIDIIHDKLSLLVQYFAMTYEYKKDEVLLALKASKIQKKELTIALFATARSSYEKEWKENVLNYYNTMHSEWYIQEDLEEWLYIVLEYFENNPQDFNIIAESQLPLSALFSLALELQRRKCGIEQILWERKEIRNYEIINSETDILFLTADPQDRHNYYIWSHNMFEQDSKNKLVKNAWGHTLGENNLTWEQSKKFTLNRLNYPKNNDSRKTTIFVSSHGSSNKLRLAKGDDVNIYTDNLFTSLKAKALRSMEKYWESDICILADSCFAYNLSEAILAKWKAESVEWWDLYWILPPVIFTLSNKDDFGSVTNIQSRKNYAEKKDKKPFTGLDFLKNIENYNYIIQTWYKKNINNKKYKENNDAGIFWKWRAVGR